MKALIFDFDGTIADSFETLLRIFEEVAARPQQLSAQQIMKLRGETLRDIIRHLKIKRWQVPRMILKAKRQLGSKMNDIKAFPDMAAVLKQLHKAGYPMFVLSTNSQHNISGFLKNNGLDGIFLRIYGDIGLRSKSSALKKIMKKEKLSRADCVYIGDEVRDIEAAKKAGVTCVGVTWGFNNAQAIKAARPNIITKKPQDLLNYLTS